MPATGESKAAVPNQETSDDRKAIDSLTTVGERAVSVGEKSAARLQNNSMAKSGIISGLAAYGAYNTENVTGQNLLVSLAILGAVEPAMFCYDKGKEALAALKQRIFRAVDRKAVLTLHQKGMLNERYAPAVEDAQRAKSS